MLDDSSGDSVDEMCIALVAVYRFGFLDRKQQQKKSARHIEKIYA